ncbi:MAG: DUF2807 domain-containing protein [bacterium]
MRRFFPHLLTGILLLSITGCSGGEVTNTAPVVQNTGKGKTEERSVSDFTSISVTGGGDLFVTQGTTESLTVEADAGILPKITTSVKNKTVNIDVDKSVDVSKTAPIKYYLTVKTVQAITISGAANIEADSFKVDKLNFTSSGSGNIRLREAEVKELTFTGSGTSNFDAASVIADRVVATTKDSSVIAIRNLKGTSLELNLNGSGGASINEGEIVKQTIQITQTGSYFASDLKSADAKISVVGPAEVQIWATKTLQTKITGDSTVSYYGSPSVTNDGNSGQVKSLGEKVLKNSAKTSN